MHQILLAAAAAMVLSASAANAQDARDDARAALAARLVDATVRDGLDKALQRVVDSQAQASELPAEQTRWVQVNMPELLRSHMESMIDQTEDLYAERLTLDQLTALVGFYETPEGREIAARQFDLNAEVGANMGPMMEAFLTEFVRKFCAAFECPADTTQSMMGKD